VANFILNHSGERNGTKSLSGFYTRYSCDVSETQNVAVQCSAVQPASDSGGWAAVQEIVGRCVIY
jgi:hypothetical protein